MKTPAETPDNKPVRLTVMNVIGLLYQFPPNATVVIDGGDWSGAVTRIDQSECGDVELHCDD